MTNPTDAQREGDLLKAARRLLGQRVNLDAVHVLHATVVRGLGKESTLLPARYVSSAEARAQQERLQDLLAEQGPHVGEATGATNAVRHFLRRQPWWAPRAAAAALLVLLILRYAWAVTHDQNWARQHPEGNWIARYYSGTKFEGNPMLRYDVGVNVDFGKGGPIRSLAKDMFSIRWDTCMLVTREVAVPLTLQADDAAQLLVDGTPQLHVEPGPGVVAANVVLRPGVRHVRVEFVERMGAALVRLEGLALEGSEAYSFRRPRVDGLDLTCLGQ